jgi:acetylornithine deacetylase/succinyl-diaminopimelate desuccinylase-like protein
MVGSPGHQKACQYLAGRLEEIGCVPFAGDSFELPYQSRGVSFCNLAGVIPGRKRRLAPLLVGAHYDSVIAAPCADDNAAAVAIALAVGAWAAEQGGLDRDLIVAIFDAEEPPYFHTPSMGSERFWHDQREGRSIHAAIIMDLVGHDVSIHS